MSEDLIATLFPIVSIMIGVGTLAGFIYRIGAWINAKAEVKAALLKKVTEDKANELREYAMSAAKEIKDINEIQVQDLKERLTKLDIKLDKIDTRQDLVNGNVGNIRDDIGDVKQDLSYVQEDITELFEDENGEQEDKSREREHNTVSIRRRKDRERDLKRQRIRSDSEYQGKRIHER